ncbi:MAG: hypothetical protein ACRENE_04090 [Polyangiaceae bacterium]
MMLDLDALRKRHDALPEWLADALASYAALALQRRHQPGVILSLMVGGNQVDEFLIWRTRPSTTTVDDKRATEDGAECVALAIVGQHRRWQIIRRLQSVRGEGADWLMRDIDSGGDIVLEISGTDEGAFEPRVRKKRAQANLAARWGTPAVSVVRFFEPKAILDGGAE